MLLSLQYQISFYLDPNNFTCGFYRVKKYLYIETILELLINELLIKKVVSNTAETIGTISMLLIEHSRAINTSASILTLPYQSLSIGK